MQKTYTTRLFFRRYAYKVVLEDVINKSHIGAHWMSPRIMRRWFFDSQIAYKLVWDTDWAAYFAGNDSRSRVRIYLDNERDYETVLSEFNKHVIQVSTPYHPSHIELMKSNALMRIQPKLVYGKFRYTIIFKTWLSPAIAEDLSAWVKNSLDYENKSAVKWVQTLPMSNVWSYSPRLYLRDEADLIMVKLAWKDEIKQIQIIMLQSEAEDAIAE